MSTASAERMILECLSEVTHWRMAGFYTDLGKCNLSTTTKKGILQSLAAASDSQVLDQRSDCQDEADMSRESESGSVTPSGIRTNV